MIIFFGFLLLLLRSCLLMLEAYFGGVSEVGAVYAWMKDAAALAVFLACLFALFRRVFLRPSRYSDRLLPEHHSGEALVILIWILAILGSDAMFEAAGQALLPAEEGASPVAAGLSGYLEGMGQATLLQVRLSSFWLHNVLVLGLLCYLPLGKHFHVLLALPNVFLANQEPKGKLREAAEAGQAFEDLEQVGVGKLFDLNWKDLLDFLTCTHCGRCTDQCPAYATGAPLSPRAFTLQGRKLAYKSQPIWKQTNGNPDFWESGFSRDGLWSCTTCGACEEACPVMIEYVDKFVDMRRFQMEIGEVPEELQKPLQSLERRGNPFGKARLRAHPFLNSEKVPLVSDAVAGESVGDLYFADSAALYEPRANQAAVAFLELAHLAEHPLGSAWSKEVDSGHDARRFGEEGLFQELRDRNQSWLTSLQPNSVVVTDPHGLNALKYDYSQDLPVLHAVELVELWLQEGRLQVSNHQESIQVSFHDPCYLGRRGGIFEPVRRLISSLPKVELVEMERNRSWSFCCGGGSLNLFREELGQQRMAQYRLAMALETGADLLLTACPYCLLNLEDAAKSSNLQSWLGVQDICEFVLSRVSPENTHEKEGVKA